MALLIVVVVLVLLTFLFMQQKSFGKLPSGKRLERIKQSPNYRDDNFQNLSKTEMMAEDASYFKLIRQYFGKGVVGREPLITIPSVKTDLKNLPDEPCLVWFGHSSYMIHIDGKNILVDPVFSERTSPVQYFGNKAYPGSMVYAAEDMPDLDVIIITHDHYDHLDYNSILKLKARTKLFCTSLGVGSHLEYWGVSEKNIIEFDWWDSKGILPGIEIRTAPARHFSGRGLTRNKTLWSSFILTTSKYKIFIGGDSGYDTHFKTIGEKYGPFDLVILENGQYNTMWPYIHMLPEQVVQASIDLKGKVLMPVHWSKYTLALHAWNEPIERALKKAIELNVTVTTPKIGEKVELDKTYPAVTWWK
jgi:L-ascorbate metabolism protein UlaG (beta-lactamase superfamily)